GRLEGRPLALRGHHAHHGAGGRHGPALRAAAGERAPDELLYMLSSGGRGLFLSSLAVAFAPGVGAARAAAAALPAATRFPRSAGLEAPTGLGEEAQRGRLCRGFGQTSAVPLRRRHRPRRSARSGEPGGPG
ncbi:unnamed protein product, partial [Durusdinium trenchii]